MYMSEDKSNGLEECCVLAGFCPSPTCTIVLSSKIFACGPFVQCRIAEEDNSQSCISKRHR